MGGNDDQERSSGVDLEVEHRRNAAQLPSPPTALTADSEILESRKLAITRGVLLAVIVGLNIVGYRLVERSYYYSPSVTSSAFLGHASRTGNESSQNASVSLLKTTLCLHPVSQSDQQEVQGGAAPSAAGKSSAFGRDEPGTEDSSSWRDVLPHLREMQCLHPALVTLDPDTAHSHLTLSEDRRHVRFGDTEQRVPENPQRFDPRPCVLGGEGVTAGRHYWELQLLGERGIWEVGVARESVPRKRRGTPSPEDGVWAVHLSDPGSSWAFTSYDTLQSLREAPRRLGLHLDYEGRSLSVYNADTGEHLYTFTWAAFTRRVFPYFCIEMGGAALRLV